jgi:hypothetical protein
MRRLRLLLPLIALLVLHFDFWRESRPRLVLGWLPEELAWRLCWMALALALLWYWTRSPETEGES